MHSEPYSYSICIAAYTHFLFFAFVKFKRRHFSGGSTVHTYFNVNQVSIVAVCVPSRWWWSWIHGWCEHKRCISQYCSMFIVYDVRVSAVNTLFPVLNEYSSNLLNFILLFILFCCEEIIIIFPSFTPTVQCADDSTHCSFFFIHFLFSPLIVNCTTYDTFNTMGECNTEMSN